MSKREWEDSKVTPRVLTLINGSMVHGMLMSLSTRGKIGWEVGLKGGGELRLINVGYADPVGYPGRNTRHTVR